MTNREAIDHIIAWNRLELDEMDPAAMNQVLALAESALAYQPAPGSVKMRIAVGRHGDIRNGYGVAEVCDELTPEPQAVDVACRGATHAAIVRAWIPPVRTPEVRGVVE